MRKNVIKRIILGTLLTVTLPIQVLAADVGDVIYSAGEVNMRMTPDDNSPIVGAMGYNAECIVLEGSDEYDWIKVESGGAVGYVAGQYFSNAPLDSGYTLAKIEAESLFIRDSKNPEADTIEALAYGDVVEVIDYDNSAWVEVVTKDGLYGYVSADFVTLYTYYPMAQMIFEPVQEDFYSDEEEYSESSYVDYYPEVEAEIVEVSAEDNYEVESIYTEEDSIYKDYYDYDTNEYEAPSYEEQVSEDEYLADEPSYDYYYPTEESYEEEYYYDVETGEQVTTTTSSSNYSGIAGTANQYLGNSYVWGGSSPGGFDCSGLAQYSYAQNGISIPRVAADQYYGGTQIPVEEAVNTPGALIFYHDLGHVAISNGDGTVTHASNYDTGVIVSDAYYSTPDGAVVY